MKHQDQDSVSGVAPDALTFKFVRASGPGGQHVNKVATAVQLRVDLDRAGLPDAVRERLVRIAPGLVTQHGELVIFAHRFRSQHKNREDALNRLASLIRQARRVPKKRLPTRPSKTQKQKRREEKRVRSTQKQLRARPKPNQADD
jgi:ribosome-associated protein